MSRLSLPSFAKVNLGLRVLRRRPDGFHDIATVFQTISLHDTIELSADRELKLFCDAPQIPIDDRNLIIKAGKALRNRYKVKSGASIRLVKRIPYPGGLGGGSSNAAVALLGLNRLWGLGASVPELHELAAAIGSDVPFFLYGGSAFGRGRGTELETLPDIRSELMLVVTPEIAVSTKGAFESLGPRNLTEEAANRILLNCRFQAEGSDLAAFDLENDLEETVFTAHPEIRRVKMRLLELGAIKAAMSGSGASVFASFDNKETRQTAMKALGDQSNWRSFAVAAISRDEYREALSEVY